MDLLKCHIELLTQLVDLLARNHVQRYIYNGSRPCGHINKTNGSTYILCRPTCKLTHGPTYRHNGHTWTHSNQTNYTMNIYKP